MESAIEIAQPSTDRITAVMQRSSLSGHQKLGVHLLLAGWNEQEAASITGRSQTCIRGEFHDIMALVDPV